MGDNKDSTGLIILGIVLGAILALALLGRRTQTLQPVQSIQPQPVQWQPIDIPRVEDIKPMQPPIQIIQTDPQLIQMASQLGKATSQLEQVTSKLQETKHMQPPVIQTDPQLIQMASQLGKATSQLEQATSKLQETIMKFQHNSMNNTPQQPLKIEIQQPIQPQPQPYVIVQPQPVQSQENLQLQHTQQNNLQDSNTIYKNNEKWEINRGADGRIKSLNIIRDVKKNN